MQLDVARVLAEKIGRDIVVEVGGDRARCEECLAEPGDARLGTELQPQEMRKLRELERPERGDLHGRAASSADVDRLAVPVNSSRQVVSHSDGKARLL